jgi:DNA-binding HxlR family transcriptional regulator
MGRKTRPAAQKMPIRGSKSGRPIMALLDLLGRRWTLRIVWELREATLTSRALRAACDDASPTVVQQRLSELRTAGFIEKLDAGGYRLTVMGKELLGTFMPLHHFAAKWSKTRDPK